MAGQTLDGPLSILFIQKFSEKGKARGAEPAMLGCLVKAVLTSGLCSSVKDKEGL